MIAPLRHFLPHFLLVAAISAPATAATDPLTDYIEQALQSNHALRSQDYAVEASARALDEARAQYWPKLGLNARYTVAEGGRQLNFPVGDLLNPVYQTLNAMTANSQNPTNFPTIDNQQISLLRDREQDTRLTVSTPLYVPQLAPQLALRSALKDAATAGREVVARGLVRDTKNAYYGLSQAQARIGILESSQRTLAENERITEALLRAGKSTRDQVLRAQAERIAIEQSLLQARNGVAQARRYLNLLRNAPPECRDCPGRGCHISPAFYPRGIARSSPRTASTRWQSGRRTRLGATREGHIPTQCGLCRRWWIPGRGLPLAR